MNQVFSSSCLEVSQGGLTPAMAALIGAGVAGVTSLVVALLQLPVQRYIAGRADGRDRQKLRIDRLSEQLNDLYGPLLLLVRQNGYLYTKLKGGKSAEWHLLENIGEVQGRPTDKALAEEILRIDKEMEDLIVRKAGLVEGSGLPDSFTRFLGHSRALRIAWDRAGVVPTVAEFEHFPKDFETEVEAAYKAIEASLKTEMGTS